MKQDWDRIRAHYARWDGLIRVAGKTDWGCEPYAWEFMAGIEMSPIERALWADIRAVGVVMYPQYPVGRRFVDFGNPCAKVAIECDGRAFHVDAQADAERQAEIEALGWTVYRIGGADCLRNTDVTEDEYGCTKLVLSPGYALIKAIADRHGIRYQPTRRVDALWLMEAA